MNKIDQITIEELDIISGCLITCQCVPTMSGILMGSSTPCGSMNLLRVYTKPKGQIPDYTEPVILPATKKTVADFCDRIHRTLLDQFRVALVRGKSVKHNPQRCGKDHELADEDVVQIIKKI